MTDVRYLFVAMPPAEVQQALLAFLMQHGLDARLGTAMFAVKNWHQSLSDRFWDPSEALIDTLRRAGAMVSAEVVPLLFNRLIGTGGGAQIHWTLHARGKPGAFGDLLDAVDEALAAVGLPRGPKHQPHITVSYCAPSPLPTLRLRPPVPWLIDELLLVRGGVENGEYRYEVDSHWPLIASRQLRLL